MGKQTYSNVLPMSSILGFYNNMVLYLYKAFYSLQRTVTGMFFLNKPGRQVIDSHADEGHTAAAEAEPDFKIWNIPVFFLCPC